MRERVILLGLKPFLGTWSGRGGGLGKSGFQVLEIQLDGGDGIGQDQEIIVESGGEEDEGPEVKEPDAVGGFVELKVEKGFPGGGEFFLSAGIGHGPEHVSPGGEDFVGGGDKLGGLGVLDEKGFSDRQA